MLHWRSHSSWGREHLSTCLRYIECQYIRNWQCCTVVNILQSTVGYLNATTNRKTRNTEPEIGPNGYYQTWWKPRVAGYGARFGPPIWSRSCFWMVLEPNKTVFLVQTRIAGGIPGPFANTRRRLKAGCPPNSYSSKIVAEEYLFKPRLPNDGIAYQSMVSCPLPSCTKTSRCSAKLLCREHLYPLLPFCSIPNGRGI